LSLFEPNLRRCSDVSGNLSQSRTCLLQGLGIARREESNSSATHAGRRGLLIAKRLSRCQPEAGARSVKPLAEAAVRKLTNDNLSYSRESRYHGTNQNQPATKLWPLLFGDGDNQLSAR